jgi:hypothetical protein
MIIEESPYFYQVNRLRIKGQQFMASTRTTLMKNIYLS